MHSVAASLNHSKLNQILKGLEQHRNIFVITKLDKLYVQILIDIAFTKLLIVSISYGTFYEALIVVLIQT